MHGVYVLFSATDQKLYVGYSKSVKTRLSQHRQGLVSATRKRLPLKCIYCEFFTNRLDAMHREKYLKSGWGRKWLYKNLPQTWKELGIKN